MIKVLLGAFLLLAIVVQSQKNYESNLLMVKVKPAFKAQFYQQNFEGTKLGPIFESIGMTEVKRSFPFSTAPRKKYHDNGIAYTDITLIHELRYAENIDPKDLIGLLMRTGVFEYVEPSYKFQPLYKPNDPEIDSLYFMEMLNMYQAWDSTMGDTNVVIGISDTGFDIDHPDLVNSVKYNYNDPIDGVDNDGDGYIDNFRGWDLGDNDNNPQVGSNWHGIYVSSFVGATADNGIQLAGSGFNCKIVPLKIESGGLLTAAYNSIVYAADHGFDVINCSWGSPNSWSQTGQDICKYATVDKNCLVIASAGNDNSDNIWYPASFDWVLSVGGTNRDSEKWGEGSSDGSTYNDFVDIMAPANELYRVNNGGGPILGGGIGTSFSAPIVSGIAGLVKSKHSGYSALQVLEQLKATARNIDTIPYNEPFSGKLGRGLVDANAAVNNTSLPGLVFDGATFTDNDDQLFLPGDTIQLYGAVINFLNNSSAATKYKLETNSPYIELLDSVQPLIAIPSGQSLNTSPLPLSFIVKESMPKNQQVFFKVIMEDGNYYNWRMVSALFNEDYLNIRENNISMSVGASGKLGYNGAQGDQSVGLGVKYKGAASSAYVIGVMASLDASKTVYSVQDGFESINTISSQEDRESDVTFYSSYNDEPMGANKIGIEVSQKTMAWDDADRQDFVIMEMSIKNTSGAPISDMSFGIYADWDVVAYNQNIAQYDSTMRTGYVNYPSGIHAGIHLLGDSSFQHYAVDNNGSGGSISIHDGNFTTAEQRTTMTGGNARAIAGLGDVSQTVGVRGLNIPVGDSITVAFALVMGDDLATITTASAEADTAYAELYDINVQVTQNDAVSCYDQCDGAATVTAKGGVGALSFNWYDVAGTPTASSVPGLCADTIHCEVSDEEGLKDTVELIIMSPAELTVDLGNDTAICEGDSNAVFDAGTATSYLWNTLDTGQTIHAFIAGEYSVVITDENGCTASDSVVLIVNELPTITITDTINSDGVACNGEINGVISGGEPAYTISWSDDLSRDSMHAINLCVDTFTVTVTDANTCVSSKTIEIQDKPVSVKVTELSKLSLFPNPTEGFITIKGLPETYDLRITNILGMEVNNVTNNQGVLDFSELDTGHYFIQITSGSEIKTHKIILKK